MTSKYCQYYDDIFLILIMSYASSSLVFSSIRVFSVPFIIVLQVLISVPLTPIPTWSSSPFHTTAALLDHGYAVYLANLAFLCLRCCAIARTYTHHLPSVPALVNPPSGLHTRAPARSPSTAYAF
ncbi:hypothetical protein M405DRAFT_833569 [Rhizopogon salebrosus TDB-379]|nr:hypothetical protein M405DRAFT_833569 [Rhizopogon salebrosus TDB-379]